VAHVGEKNATLIPREFSRSRMAFEPLKSSESWRRILTLPPKWSGLEKREAEDHEGVAVMPARRSYSRRFRKAVGAW